MEPGGHAVADADGEIDVGVELILTVDAAYYGIRRESTDNHQEDGATVCCLVIAHCYRTVLLSSGLGLQQWSCLHYCSFISPSFNDSKSFSCVFYH